MQISVAAIRFLVGLEDYCVVPSEMLVVESNYKVPGTYYHRVSTGSAKSTIEKVGNRKRRMGEEDC